MPFWQREYVREGVSMDLNGTYRLDLPDNGLLGSLLLRFSGGEKSGLGQAGGAWRIIDFLSKLEVLLNGATVCKSFTGYIAQALAFYDQGVIPPGAWRNYATNTQYEYVLLNFGRGLFDPELLLDLGKFKDVELRVSNIVAASEFSDLTIAVMGLYLREGDASRVRGYMRTEEWRSWTTIADETKYLELPIEHPIRRIILQAEPDVDASYVEETNMANLMDDIELSLDTGQVRVYKGGIDDLMRENFLDLGKEALVCGYAYHNADKGIRIDLGYTLGGAWGAGSSDGAGAGTVATLESGRTSYTQKAETYEGDHPIGFLFKGLAPFETALFRFDHDFDPGAWLNPARRATVKLDIHTRNSGASADGLNKVILDRFVRY